MRHLLNRLKQLVDLIHTYPAVVGMIVSMAVAVLAHYGLKLDAAKATGLLVAVDAIVFSWIHGNVSPVMPAVWRQRRN